LETITAFLELIKQYGLALVGLVYFAYMYSQNNKDSLKLIIAVKDENNNLRVKNIDAIYVLKDEIKDEIKNEVGENTDKIIQAISSHDERKSESIRKLEEKTSRIETYLFMRRGDEK
jgi:hypothetical protein